MNADERQALREKHRSKMVQQGKTHEEGPFCSYCTFNEKYIASDGYASVSVGNPVPYPCDVIKVLDAWQEQTEKLLAIIYDTNAITHADSVEAMRRILTGTATENLKSTDLKTEVECEHWVSVTNDGDFLTASEWAEYKDWWEFTYCPKCGEKL